MTNHVPYWVALSRVPGIGSMRMRLLIDTFGTAQQAWRAPHSDLLAAGLDTRSADALVLTRHSMDLDAEMAKLERADAGVLTWADDAYPQLLREAEGSPPVLYMLGKLLENDDWAIGVVGTRRVTTYGREATTRLSSELAEKGITIVSGLARGVDTIAHRAALDTGGRTIAVLGSGVDVIYPQENRSIVRQIVEQELGAVISEYPLGTQPDAVNFPPRNRIISGLSRGVLVVEAGERSGALITVSFALEQGRDVFAVPTQRTQVTHPCSHIHRPCVRPERNGPSPPGLSAAA